MRIYRWSVDFPDYVERLGEMARCLKLRNEIGLPWWFEEDELELVPL